MKKEKEKKKDNCERNLLPVILIGHTRLDTLLEFGQKTHETIPEFQSSPFDCTYFDVCFVIIIMIVIIIKTMTMKIMVMMMMVILRGRI